MVGKILIALGGTYSLVATFQLLKKLAEKRDRRTYGLSNGDNGTEQSIDFDDINEYTRLMYNATDDELARYLRSPWIEGD